MDPNTILLFGMPAIPMINAVVYALRVAFNLPNHVVPIVSIMLGVIAGLGLESATTGSHLWVRGAAVGVFIGLSASGLYSGGKAQLEAQYTVTPKKAPVKPLHPVKPDPLPKADGTAHPLP